MITSWEEFQAEWRTQGTALVVSSMPISAHTPLGAYARLAGQGKQVFLFESAEGESQFARYSFVGTASAELSGSAAGTQLLSEDVPDIFDHRNAIDVLRERLSHSKITDKPDLPPFVGGAVGYLAYEAAAWFESAVTHDPRSAGNLGRFMLVDELIAFDHSSNTLQIIALARGNSADATEARSAYETACRRISDLLRCLDSAAPVTTQQRAYQEPLFQSNFDQAGFEAAVACIQQNIIEGNCYQAVLSQRLTATTSASAFDIYRALRQINPSPYLFLLDFGDEQLIGASPEMLVRCRGGVLDYRPIAGTVPRGKTPSKDDELAARLLADEKERAEHMMLVDLGRNDLGRVAETGSVEVNRLMHIERFSHVQHIVTDLKARLREGLDGFDALAACFPAGTVTGAPKVRAMELIRSLETVPRETYAGAVFYADVRGNLDSCIAIRTVRRKGHSVAIQCGAGIVFDSNPGSEYQETLHKAGAMMEAVRAASGRRE